MAQREGRLNSVLTSSLAVGTNDALFIQLKGAPGQIIEIHHINWAISFLVTPIPTVAADQTYTPLKIIRNQSFVPTQNYGDAFGSNADLFDMMYQDIIVGPAPGSSRITFFSPLRSRESEDVLIVVSAPLSSFAGSFGATLLVKGNYANLTTDPRFPYELR